MCRSIGLAHSHLPCQLVTELERVNVVALGLSVAEEGFSVGTVPISGPLSAAGVVGGIPVAVGICRASGVFPANQGVDAEDEGAPRDVSTEVVQLVPAISLQAARAELVSDASGVGGVREVATLVVVAARKVVAHEITEASAQTKEDIRVLWSEGRNGLLQHLVR